MSVSAAQSALPNGLPPLPVSVVTGYLGSGKTTLINQLLANARGRRITVLVNDFGEISLDEALIENRDGDVIALANGCMCCQIGGDLYRTIDRILALREKIDHVIVETSGVADPSKISQIAAAEPELADNGTLTLVDVANFSGLAQQPMLRDTLERQLSKADLLLLTKLNGRQNQATAEVFMAISRIAPDCPIIGSADETIARLLTPEGFKSGVSGQAVAAPLKPHTVPFESWTWQGDERLNQDHLVALLRQRALSIYRCKGLVRFDDGSSALINKVGDTIDIAATEANLDHSVLTMIGVKPGFDHLAVQAAWHQGKVISEPTTPSRMAADDQ